MTSIRTTDKPLVSIICTAFNHEKYIELCIEGFIKQETDFKFEVLINEDASTDNTAHIIQEYEKRYPHIIKPIYQVENQYSKRVGLWKTILFPRARGKYIALCEGDDYWTDPLKLQKQVDFLEANNDYILVCGGFKAVKPTGEYKEKILTSIVPPDQEDVQGFTFTLRDLSRAWFTKTLTTLFRNTPDLKNYAVKYDNTRDVHLFHFLLRSGKGYYMKRVLGVYNMHEGGISSLKSRERKLVTHYYIYKDMYEKSPDEYTRVGYLAVCQELLNLKISFVLKDKKIKVIDLLVVILRLTKRRSEFLHSIEYIIPRQIKSFLLGKSRLGFNE